LKFPLYIAKRYLRTSSKNNAINIISRIATIGIVVGAMALFVVLSVFSGLKDFSLSFSNDFDPDIKVTPITGKTFKISEEQEKKLTSNDGIVFFSKVVEEKVLFLYKNKEQVASLKGVDNHYILVNKVTKSLSSSGQGQWLFPKTDQVVIGNGIAQKLSIGLLDIQNVLEVYAPKSGKGAISNPEEAFNKAPLTPMGIYAINDELDSKYVFSDIELAQELLQLKPNEITSLELKLSEQADEDAVITFLKNVFDFQVVVQNRARQNDSLYKMLNSENTAIYLIFTLVIILTLFTLAGAIIMMILDKKKNLKTLYDIGTPIKDLQKIFLLQGSILSIFGGLLGLFMGSIVILIQQIFKIIMITDTLAYPVAFRFQNIFIVFFTILTLGVIASWIASSRVTKKLLD
jgi:lipoprotein-releasing system permease protein